MFWFIPKHFPWLFTVFAFENNSQSKTVFSLLCHPKEIGKIRIFTARNIRGFAIFCKNWEIPPWILSLNSYKLYDLEPEIPHPPQKSIVTLGSCSKMTNFLVLTLFFGKSPTLGRVYGGGPGCFTPDQPVSETKRSIIVGVSPSLCRNFDSAAPGPKKKKLQNLKSSPKELRGTHHPDEVARFRIFFIWGAWKRCGELYFDCFYHSGSSWNKKNRYKIFE